MKRIAQSILILVLRFSALADDLHDYPLRGFIPSETYHLSDIETINTGRGNVILHLPLVSLPPGHGGLSAGLSLVYNSQGWDASGSVTCTGNSSGGYTPSTQTVLLAGDDQAGPWSYGYKYSIRTISTLDAYNNSPCTPTCPDPNAIYTTKYELIGPDGNVHNLSLRPTTTHTPLSSGNLGIYWNRQPDGSVLSCGINGNGSSTFQQVPDSGQFVFYTTDGTYLRIVADAGNVDGSFTIYFPDGKTVQQPAAGPQVLSECRGTAGCNRITFDGTLNLNTATYSFALGDDQDRTIQLSSSGSASEDIISASGFGQAALTWTVHWKTVVENAYYAPFGSAARQAFPASNTTCQLGSNSIAVVNQPCPVQLEELLQVSQVDVPSQLAGQSGLGTLSYYFSYGETFNSTDNQWETSHTGELRSVQLPTGATAQYTYYWDSGAGACDQGYPCYDQLMNNPVASKTLTFPSLPLATGQTTAAEVWHYNIGPNGGGTTVINPDGSSISEAYNGGLLVFRTLPSGETVQQNWRQNFPTGQTQDYVPALAGNQQYSVNNPFIAEKYDTLPDTNAHGLLTGITVNTIDRKGNSTGASSYDWIGASSLTANGTGGLTLPSGLTLLRSESRTFNNTANWVSLQTGTDPCSGNPLYICSGTTGALDALAQETISGPGNSSARQLCYDASASPELLQEARWDSTLGALPSPLMSCASGRAGAAAQAIVTSRTYDSHGNVQTETDPSGYTITYNRQGMQTCSAAYQAAGQPQPTVDSPYPYQSIRQVASGVAETWNYQTDCSTGLVTEETDPNGVAKSSNYDPLGRLISLKLPDVWVQHSYADDQRFVVTRTDLATAGDGLVVTVSRFDELGRPSLVQQWENSSTFSTSDTTSGIKTSYSYSNLTTGNSALASNPFRGSATDGWTMTYKDSSGRTTAVGKYSGSTPPPPFGSSTSSPAEVLYAYNGGTTMVTEEDLKEHNETHDPLGRLVGVVEATQSSTPVTTSYTYDGLNNLSNVSQNIVSGTPGQTRQFTYSSLSRLMETTNPESGSINYTYFPNGTLHTRMDTRNTITYQYDGLQRILSKSYSGQDTTPNVIYCYDGATSTAGGTCQAGTVANSIGRLTSVTNVKLNVSPAVGTTTLYLSYDAEGRVLSSEQQTDTTQYAAFHYQYTPGGMLKQIQYPSGRVVGYGVDTMGRTSAVARTASVPAVGSETASNAYVWGLTYQPSEQLQGLRYGTTGSRYETWSYNFRQQPTLMQLGSSSGAGDVWQLQNDYGADGSNHGNVLWQYLTPVPGKVISTGYLYDAFNRLSLADEKPGTANNSFTGVCPDSGSVWCFQFQYDPYGNRTIVQRAGTGSGVALNEPPGYVASNNRITGGTWLYDTRGNVQQDGAGAGYVLDAENRMRDYCPGGSATCSDTAPGATVYSYDGDGRRVKTVTPSWTSIFVYDAQGQLAAEYGGAATAQSGTEFVMQDHLGNTRVVMDAAGDASERVDYQPFGGEVPTAAGDWRASVSGYGLSSPLSKLRFTSKERDSETGLDYFGARYFSSAQGRFTSADRPFADQHAINPQSWNLYSYTLNNPLRYVDPNGRGVVEGLRRGFDNIGIGMISVATQPDRVVAGAWNAVSHPGRTIQGIGAAFSRFWNSSPDEKVTSVVSFGVPAVLGGAAGAAGVGASAGTVATLGSLSEGTVAAAGAEAATSTTSLFRAVGSAEAESIGTTGAFTNPYGIEIKGFFFNQSDAQSFGSRMTQMTGDTHTVVSGEAPTSLVNSAIPHSAATEGPGVYFKSEQLPQVKVKLPDQQ